MFLKLSRPTGALVLLLLLLPGESSASFLSNQLQPAIDHAGEELGDLAAEVDASLGKRLTQAGGIGKELIADVDTRLAGRVDDLDTRLQTRILQITTGANELVDNAIGSLDDAARNRIAQLGKTAERAITQVDTAAQRLLDRADAILEERLADLRAIVSTAIRDADNALQERIAQLDEAVGRRLGNADAIATKQRIGFERSLIRFAVAASACVFVIVMLWNAPRTYRLRLQRGVVTRLRAAKGVVEKANIWFETMAWPVAASVAAAIAAVTAIYFILDAAPLGAKQELVELRRSYHRAFDDSLRRFDFMRARYQAAQLAVLEPEAAASHSLWVEKARLFEAAFGRPTALASADGRAAVRTRLVAVEQLTGGRADPDALVIRAMLKWKQSSDRTGEYRAASLCARALRIAPNFVLAPLAQSYVRAFLHAPYIAEGTLLGRESESLAALRSLVAGPDIVPADFPLGHVIALDRLVRILDEASTASYLAMLDAHSEFLATSSEAARNRRTRAARAVLAAWREFDQGLSDPALGDHPSILVVFALNDAVLTRALWFVEQQQTRELAPLLTKIRDPYLRTRLAPPRIAWTRRYGALLGSHAAEIIDFEEARRFKTNEKTTAKFDAAYVEARTAELSGDDNNRTASQNAARWRRVGTLGAQLGFYVSRAGHRVPLAWDHVPQVRRWLASISRSSGSAVTDVALTTEAKEELATLRAALATRARIFL